MHQDSWRDCIECVDGVGTQRSGGILGHAFGPRSRALSGSTHVTSELIQAGGALVNRIPPTASHRQLLYSLLLLYRTAFIHRERLLGRDS